MGPLDDEEPRKKRRIYEEALMVQMLAPRRGVGAFALLLDGAVLKLDGGILRLKD